MAATGARALHRLIYTSTAAEPMFAEKLDRILLRAQVANRERGVTGLLLFREGRFLQVLEGPRGVLNDLYGRISRDRTHRDLLLLDDGPCAQRLFAATPLAYLAGRYFTNAQCEAFGVLARFACEAESQLAAATPEPVDRMIQTIRDGLAA